VVIDDPAIDDRPARRNLRQARGPGQLIFLGIVARFSNIEAA
jgi:hypothetical protein